MLTNSTHSFIHLQNTYWRPRIEKSSRIDVGDRNTKDRSLNKTDESRKSPKGGNIKIEYLHGKPLPTFQGSAHMSLQCWLHGRTGRDIVLLVFRWWPPPSHSEVLLFSLCINLSTAGSWHRGDTDEWTINDGHCLWALLCVNPVLGSRATSYGPARVGFMASLKQN